jgi:tight adherence protein B
MTDAAPLIAIGAGLTAAFAVLGARQMVQVPDRRTEARLAALRGSAVEVSGNLQILRDRRVSRLPLLDSLLRRTIDTERVRRKLQLAGLPLRIGEYFTLRLALAAIAVVAAVVANSSLGLGGLSVPLAGASGLFGWFAPALYVRRRAGQRAERIDAQLVEMCDLMASMLTSGFGYLQALGATARQLDDPLAGELRQLLDAVALGGDVDEAFLEMSERLSSADVDIVATAIIIQRSSGGNLSEILRGVARTVRDRQAVRLELRTLTSRERYSAVVVTGFPFLIVGALTLLLPETFGLLFRDPVGRMILGAAILLDLVGFMAIKRVSKVEY